MSRSVHHHRVDDCAHCQEGLDLFLALIIFLLAVGFGVLGYFWVTQ